ncbi:MAG TPA: glycosyltransferase family 2 protein [Gemmataceae bacterium]|jgi:glycosyltransferase involved in cell wall biosynthesis|nr:glycosyltransferase family 2 protein [Gemmataceae bacterium]
MPHPDNKPAIAKEAITVALPVHNQANHLEKSMRAWIQFLRQRGREFEVILIDDGSTDETGTLALALAKENPEVTFMQQPAARGFGAALRMALEKAQYPLFFYTSLDYPYAPADLQKLLDRIDDVDLISGYRSGQKLPLSARILQGFVSIASLVFVGLKRDPLPGWLGWKAHLYSWLVRFLVGVHIVDVDSAFKLFRREIFARIPIQSGGILVHTEVIAKANFLNYWMDEIPIGAGGGAAPAIPFSWREHFREMRRLLYEPDFGPATLPARTMEAKATNSIATPDG